MSLARRLAPSMPALRSVLVLVALLGHLLLPLAGSMPTAGSGGPPGADICSSDPKAGSSPGSPLQPHDKQSCVQHCLGHAAASGPPVIAQPAWFPTEYRHVRPAAPGVSILPVSAAAPFAARAPPPSA